MGKITTLWNYLVSYEVTEVNVHNKSLYGTEFLHVSSKACNIKVFSTINIIFPKDDII